MRAGRLSVVIAPIVLGLVVLAVWQLVVKLGNVPAYVMPSPSAVAHQIHDSWSHLVGATKISGTNAVLGLIAGTILATVFAVVAQCWRPADGVLSSLAAGASAMPIVALAPLCYGAFSATAEFPRRLVVTVLVFFPIYINVSKGLRQVAVVQRELMHCNGASWWATVRYVRIPTATPFLFSGLRIAAPGAVITAIVSEYFGGGQNGLAFFITSAAANSAYAQAWAYVSASVFLGLVAFIVSASLERLVQHRLGGPA